MVVFGGIASIAVCLFAFVIAANREEEPQAPTQPKAQFAGDWNKASPQSVVPTVEDDGRKAGGDIRPLLPGGEYVYRRLLKSTVWIHREDGVTGTGTIIDQGGKFVLTAAHVVGNSEYVKVFFPISRNGKVVTSRSQHEILKDSETSAWATVVRRDGSKDLAILELASIPEGFTGLPIAKDSPSPGQPVHSLGACPTPGEAMWVYTSGAVRQVYQKVERIPNGQEVIELNATVVDTQSPINRGDSGGPLVNQRAELMGVACSFAGNAFLVSTFIELAEVHLFVDSFYAEEA
jgi:S1-C subfamily serine protease